MTLALLTALLLAPLAAEVAKWKRCPPQPNNSELP
jgi:hypothetical protein